MYISLAGNKTLRKINAIVNRIPPLPDHGISMDEARALLQEKLDRQTLPWMYNLIRHLNNVSLRIARSISPEGLLDLQKILPHKFYNARVFNEWVRTAEGRAWIETWERG